MNVIAKPRGTGKTRELLTMASMNNGQVLTTNKYALRAKAEAYGITNVPIYDWEDILMNEYDYDKPLYVHKAEEVFTQLFENDFQLKLAGLSILIGE